MADEKPSDHGLLGHYSAILHQITHSRAQLDPPIPENVSVDVGDVNAAEDSQVIIGVPAAQPVSDECVAAVETAIIAVAELVTQTARKIAGTTTLRSVN